MQYLIGPQLPKPTRAATWVGSSVVEESQVELAEARGVGLDAGAEAHQELRDVGGGKLIASVKDADGNVIGLIQSA